MGYCFWSQAQSQSTMIASDLSVGRYWRLAGRRSEKILKRVDGSEEMMPSKCDRIVVNAGDILYFNTWGGDGCGDPKARN